MEEALEKYCQTHFRNEISRIDKRIILDCYQLSTVIIDYFWASDWSFKMVSTINGYNGLFWAMN